LPSCHTQTQPLHHHSRRRSMECATSLILSLLSTLLLLSHAGRLALPLSAAGDLDQPEGGLRTATVPRFEIDAPLSADGSRRRYRHRGAAVPYGDGVIASVHAKDGEAGGEAKTGREKAADGWQRTEAVDHSGGEEYKKKDDDLNSGSDEVKEAGEEEPQLQTKNKNKDKEKNKEKNKDKDKEKEKNKNKDKEKEKNKEKNKDKEKNKEKDKDKEKNKNKDKEKNKEKDKEKEKNKNKDKEKNKEKEKNKDKEKSKHKQEKEGEGWMKWYRELKNRLEL
ncbi:unnamed protein product, partial [Musa hybrid cultivar]